MRRGAKVLSVAVVILYAESVTAQTAPDFSGKWTVVPDRSAAGGRGGGRGGHGASGALGSGWGTEITVTQDAAKLTIQTTYFTARDLQPPLKFVYLLNGSESKNTVLMGRGPQEQTSKAVWDGSKLFIRTVHSFKDPQSGAAMTSETKQVLSLESPTSLVVETTRSAALGGPPSTTKTMYRKN
jgi:hypothetical protein